MIKLYENIRELRKHNNWSQDELAKRMGYTDRSMIAKIESGVVDLAESKIMAFAHVFGVKPSYLMGWDSDSPAAADKVDISLTRHEYDLIRAYRVASGDTRAAACAVLGVKGDQGQSMEESIIV